MIDELHIRDLGVISDTRVPLGPGFTAITGETGAGKTMVVTALGLLMGQRADAAAVRSGANAAQVSGIVHVADADVATLVDELGGEIEEGELILSRAVSAEGRSRATAGGAAVPVGALGRIAERLFAVHGQSEQLRLKSSAAQRETLDRFGGAPLTETLDRYRTAHARRRELQQRIAELTENREARETEAALLRSALDEISAVDPQPGEDRELSERLELLRRTEELRTAALAAGQAIASDADDPVSLDATALIDGALQQLDRVAGVDARLDDVASVLRDASFQLVDAGRDLAAYVTDLDASGPVELERANERMHALSKLTRQYGDTSDAVLAYAAESAQRLAELDVDGESLGQLHHELDTAANDETSLAAEVTALREVAAERLAAAVTGELRQLALPDAEFVVAVGPLEALASHGRDDVQFRLRPHPGVEPKPVAKSASGGELSRVMLALEVVLAGADPVPTFVFDEVDAGIGGAAAIEIGRRLARLARTSQVIVVTHLAQVAAFAQNHLRIVKDSTGGFTRSSLMQLDGDTRLDEMARLLSGLASSESAREHAGELLALARD